MMADQATCSPPGEVPPAAATLPMVRYLPAVTALAAALIASVVLIGWAFSAFSLVRMLPQGPAMSPLVAWVLLVLAVGVWLAVRQDMAWAKGLSAACGALVVLIGLTVLMWPGTIDQLLFATRLARVPAQMAPASALGALLLGCSLVAMARQHDLSAQLLALVAAGVAWTQQLALLSGLVLPDAAHPAADTIMALPVVQWFGAMALPTAVAIVLLTFGILFARTDAGMAAILVSDSAGGVLSRRLLPVVLLGLPALHGLELAGLSAGWFDSRFGMFLDTSLTSLLLTVLLIGTAGILHRLDRHRTASLASLAASEGRKAAILESSLEAIISMDDGGRITEFNRAAEELFGYRHDEVIGRDLSDRIIPPAFRERHRQGLARYLASGEGAILNRRVEMMAMRADGGEFPIELAISVVPAACPPMFTGMIRDITDQKRAEAEREQFLRRVQELSAAAQQRAEQLRVILDTMRDAVMVCDAAGRITMLNSGATRLYGLEADEVPRIGLAWDLLLRLQPRYPDGRAMSRPDLPLYRSLSTGTEVAMVLQVLIPDRQGDRTLSIAASPIRDERGAVVGAVAVGRDITEEAEFELIKDQFVQMAAHELKTPVTVMKGYAQALLRFGGKLPDNVQHGLAGVARGADRIVRIIEDLLMVSGDEAATMQPQMASLDLAGLVAETVATMGKSVAPQYRLHPRTPAAAVPVQGDPARLRQVVKLLLDNAVKFSPQGGDIEVSLTTASGEAIVTVQDQGIGIPQDKQGRIFGRFFRAHTDTPFDVGGMGVSLYLAKRIISQHGGRIWFESTPGGGSSFHFSLPMADGQSPP
jgi:PAS domain S-box-containing protein